MGDTILVHFIEQLFLLFFVQLSHQSSQSSPFSTLLFQQTEVVFLHSNEHFQSYPLFIQLSHSSQISSISFQHFAEHFSHRSTGHVSQSSHGSCTQFQQFGLYGLYSVHIFVHPLSGFQLSSPLSHTSFVFFVQSQHLLFGSIFLQYSVHFQSNQLCTQLSHSSHGSISLFQHDHLHDFTSLSQFEQFSEASISPFQQCQLHSQTSASQLVQFSSFCIIPSQHTGFSPSSIQISPKSSGQISQSSLSSIL
jgi:hypothetical protein